MYKLLGDNIMAGAGYSSDSQQTAPQACYNASISSTSGQEGFAKLDTAMSFSDLENELKIDVSLRGHYGMFSASAAANYMRSAQD